jgi:hypothetical protein
MWRDSEDGFAKGGQFLRGDALALGWYHLCFAELKLMLSCLVKMTQ